MNIGWATNFPLFETYLLMKYLRNSMSKKTFFFLQNMIQPYVVCSVVLGNAGDSLRVHDIMDFSTNDQDNDKSQENCAENHQSGWWYNDCYSAHLNGRYFSTDNHTGIYWYDWKNAWLRLKKISMKLGP